MDLVSQDGGRSRRSGSSDFCVQATRRCQTEHLRLVGAENFEPAGERVLNQTYGLDADVAEHLHHAFGDRAVGVAKLAESALGARFHPQHPYLEAEVVYVTRFEFAERASDVLTRRLPLALLDKDAAIAALPRVIELMANELGWNRQRRDEEREISLQRLAGCDLKN